MTELSTVRHSSNFRSPAALCRFLLVAVLGLTADLAVKHYAFERLTIAMETLPDGRVEVESKTVRLIPDWLHLHVTVNQGAVFGLGQGKQILFAIVSLGAVVFLFYLFATSGRQRFYQVLLGMLMAGVIGNLYDRLTFHYVRDMIHGLPGFEWPRWFVTKLPVAWQSDPMPVFPWIFNVADSLLVVGVGAMILYSFFHGETKVEEKNS